MPDQKWDGRMPEIAHLRQEDFETKDGTLDLDAMSDAVQSARLAGSPKPPTRSSQTETSSEKPPA